jgi:fatty acid desaturase
MADALPTSNSRKSGTLADLCARNSWRAIATITAEYAFIAISVTIGQALQGVWTYLAIVLFVGTRQYALGECMAHEASHRNLSSTRWLNEGLGIAVCWPFFVTLGGYRRFHNRLHHRVSLTDDENSIYEDYEDWGLPPEEIPLSRWAGYWHLVVKPLVGVIGVRHLIKTIQDFYWDRDLAENTIMLAVWAAIVAAATYFALLDELLLYWIVPWLIVVPVLNYWSEVGDHYRVTGALTRSNLNWALNTLVAHNIGYHALHHRHPSIPWFRLARAYPIFHSELEEQVSNGYLSTFRQIMAAKPVVGTSDACEKAAFPSNQFSPPGRSM